MPNAPTTLAERLAALFPDSSGRSRKEWLRDGRVLRNGRVERDGRAAIGPLDRIELGPRERPFPAPLERVHEDDAILVIEKPPGLLTIATEREKERTAYRLVWDYLAGGSPPARPYIVHRLDRETSGLLVLAKTPEAKRRLQDQFERRTALREYLALVEGSVSEDRGTLAGRLVTDRSLRVRVLPEGRAGRGPGAAADPGKEAVTHFRVLSRRGDTTPIEITLGTGRRGQIRAQLAEYGHPVRGDLANGGERSKEGRLCLHATRLGFAHPETGKSVEFRSEAAFAKRKGRGAS